MLKVEEYKGAVGWRSKDERVRQAYSAWRGQRARLGTEYSAREFVSWWLHNLKKKKWIDPTTGRLDHSRGYSFDNIEMQERSDNTKEMCARTGNLGGVKRRKVLVVCEEFVRIYPSTRSVTRDLNIYQSRVIRLCRNEAHDKTYFMRYME